MKAYDNKDNILLHRCLHLLHIYRCEKITEYLVADRTQESLPSPAMGKGRLIKKVKYFFCYFWMMVSLSMATADFSTVIFRPPVPTSKTTVFSLTSASFP